MSRNLLWAVTILLGGILAVWGYSHFKSTAEPAHHSSAPSNLSFTRETMTAEAGALNQTGAPGPIYFASEWKLLVTTNRSNQPVAAASVLVAPWNLIQEAVGTPPHLNPEVLLERYGNLYQTDTNGKVHIPFREKEVLVGVRSGDLWGSVRLKPNTVPPLTPLVVKPTRQFRVSLSGAKHFAPATPIGLFSLHEGEVTRRLQAITNLNGVAYFEIPSSSHLDLSSPAVWWFDTIPPQRVSQTQTYSFSNIPLRYNLHVPDIVGYTSK